MKFHKRFALRLAAFTLLCILFVAAVSVTNHLDERSDTSVKPALQSIRINYATAEELQQLDGLDDTLSARILTYRSNFELFTSVDQLLEIDGITPELLALWRPYITV